jgi:hypothetical protein
MMRNWIYKTPGLAVLVAELPGDVEGDTFEESGPE